MILIVQFLVLVFIMMIYMYLASKYNIVDIPNHRSSHTKSTIRGGGIIFVASIVLFFLLYQFQYPYFFSGLILIATISFLDDIYSLSSRLRFTFQLLTVILMIYEVTHFNINLLFLFLLIIIITGLLNIYNFMDGINGITGLYSLSIVLPLIYLNEYYFLFVNKNLLILTFFSLIIFGYYNFRKKAKCFAGDVGSISIGLILFFCLGLLIYKQQNWYYAFFVLVYAIDGGFTIVERLFKKQNIFLPHRNHLYQKLVDNPRYTHLKVAIFYGIMQSIVCWGLIFSLKYNVPYLILFFGVILSIGYLYLKKRC